jgi:hypothetical protein
VEVTLGYSEAKNLKGTRVRYPKRLHGSRFNFTIPTVHNSIVPNSKVPNSMVTDLSIAPWPISWLFRLGKVRLS